MTSGTGILSFKDDAALGLVLAEFNNSVQIAARITELSLGGLTTFGTEAPFLIQGPISVEVGTKSDFLSLVRVCMFVFVYVQMPRTVRTVWACVRPHFLPCLPPLSPPLSAAFLQKQLHVNVCTPLCSYHLPDNINRLRQWKST